MTQEADTAAGYKIMEKLQHCESAFRKSTCPLKDKNGNALSLWRFKETVKLPANPAPPVIPSPIKLVDIKTNFQSKIEISGAIKSHKLDKVSDPDLIWIPTKFASINHEEATCQVIHHGFLTETFSIPTGDNQECLLSPKILLVAIN